MTALDFQQHPRPIRVRPAFRRAMLVFHAIFLALLVVALALTLWHVGAPVEMIATAYVAIMAWYGLPFIGERNLLRWGQVAPAMIVDRQEYEGRNGPCIRLTYRFTDQDGRRRQAVRGEIPLSSPEELAALACRPTVFFDPKDSRKSTLYPPIWVALV